MAVAFSTSANAATNAAATSRVLYTATVGGSNPVLIVGAAANNFNGSITSVTWSLGGGTPVKVVERTESGSGAGVVFSIWAIPAPSAGSGTVTVVPSSSLVLQSNAVLFIGADQTTPCPTGNATSIAGNGLGPPTGTSYALVPTSVGASDLTYGGGGSATAGNPTGATPNSLYFSTATNTNYEDGWGTTSVTYNIDTSLGVELAMCAVRIVAAAAGGGVSLPPFISDRGMDGLGSPGRFFKGME